MTEPQDPTPSYGETPKYESAGGSSASSPSTGQSYPSGEQYSAAQQYSTEQYPTGQQSQYPTGQQYSAPQQYSAAPTYAAPQYGPPKSNAGWAAASLIFFWPLAFAAFNHLHDIYPKWAMGDHQGAQYASERVKKLGQISLAIAVIGFVLLVLFYIVIIAAAVSSVNTTY